MRYFFLLCALFVALTGCKKDKEPLNEQEAKELQVLGWAQTGDNNILPALWTEQRQLNFLPIRNDAHYKMNFVHKVDGEHIYFGLEDVHSPASSKAIMWKGTAKTILSEKTLNLAQQERINSWSVNPITNDIYILAADLGNFYYYTISNDGNSVARTAINVGAHGIPVYIQAIGPDIHLLTVTQVYSDQVTEGKTIIRHLKNDVLYATYEIALNEEEYLWNNLQIGSAYIENNQCHLLAVADQSLEYFYLQLSKNAPVVQRPFQTEGYTPAFGAETGSISSAQGVFENGRFYVAAKKDARDLACLVIDVKPATPTTSKVVLEAPAGHTTYTATRTYKYGEDLYLSGVANDFGVYWKNGKLVVPDKNGLNMSRIAHISFQ
ncbi:hypothetical protein [Pedobacter sp. SYSU D00535]|uniref:hypothetical protein n=1 Tax=Pedobacter sp. SYSU D00535 TaxID=2810308 RepID=UPI001A95A4E5|nr:hypothetical protein [Pedobacter sp. SYSU D00535]